MSVTSSRQPQRSLLLSSTPISSRRLSSANRDSSARHGLSRPSSSSGLGCAVSVHSLTTASVAGTSSKVIRRRSSGSSVTIARDAPSWVGTRSVTSAALKARPQSLLFAARRASGNWRTPSSNVVASANPRRASASAIGGVWIEEAVVARRESHTTTTTDASASCSDRPSSTSSASSSAPGTPTDERNTSPVLGHDHKALLKKPQRAPLAPFTARTWARELQHVSSPHTNDVAAMSVNTLGAFPSPTSNTTRQIRTPVRRYVSSEGLRAAALRPLSQEVRRTPMTLEGARAIARRASAGSIGGSGGGLTCATAWRDFAAASGAGSKRNSTDSIASIRETAPPGSASAQFPDVPFRVTPACVVRRRSQQRSVGACDSPIDWEFERRRSGAAMSPVGSMISRPGSVLGGQATPGSMSLTDARRKAKQVAKRHSDGIEYADWPRVASPQPIIAPVPATTPLHVPKRNSARPQTATQPGQLLGALANAPSPPPRAMSPVMATSSTRRASKRRQRTATPPGAGGATLPTAPTNFALPFRPLSVQQPLETVVVAAKPVEALVETCQAAPTTPPKSRTRQLAPQASQAPRPISKDGREGTSPFSLSLSQALDDSAAHPYADASSFRAASTDSPARSGLGGCATEGVLTGLGQDPSPQAARPSRVRRLSRAIRRALSFSRSSPPPLSLAASLEPMPKRARATVDPLAPLRRVSTREAPRTPQRRASGSAVLAQAWRQDLARGPMHAPPSAWSPTHAGVNYTSASHGAARTTTGGGTSGMSGYSSSSTLSGHSTAPPQTPSDSPLGPLPMPSVRSGTAGVKGKRNSAGATMAFVRLRAKSLGATKRPRASCVALEDVPLPTHAGKRSSVTSVIWPVAWSSNGHQAGVGDVGAGCLPTAPLTSDRRSEAVEELCTNTPSSLRKARSVKYSHSNATLRRTGTGTAYNVGIGAAAGSTTPPKKRASLQSLSSYLRR